MDRDPVTWLSKPVGSDDDVQESDEVLGLLHGATSHTLDLKSRRRFPRSSTWGFYTPQPGCTTLETGFPLFSVHPRPSMYRTGSWSGRSPSKTPWNQGSSERLGRCSAKNTSVPVKSGWGRIQTKGMKWREENEPEGTLTTFCDHIFEPESETEDSLDRILYKCGR